jgi:hypothetical protein
VAVVLVGIGFAVYAGVQWLQTARWQPLTVSGALASWPTTREWIAQPDSWLGLHRLVTWILRVPVFGIVTLVGVALVMLSGRARLDRDNAWRTWQRR